ncbi:MAG: DUF885 domain-containing protein [Phycisphaerales bacterium JB040]
MPTPIAIGRTGAPIPAILALCAAFSTFPNARASLPAPHASTRTAPAQPDDTRPWQRPCPDGRDTELWSFMDRYVEGMHRMNPGLGQTLGDDRYNHLLGDSSAEAVAESERWARERKAELEGMDRAGFSEADHLSADLILDELTRWLASAHLKTWQMPVDSLSGPQIWLPQMGQGATLTEDRHYTDYVTKLGQVETQLTDATENMRLGMAEGRVPPRVTLANAVEQSMAQASPSILEDPTTSPFFGPLNRLPESDPRRDEAARIIREQIAPAYIEFAQFLQNEYIPACRETVGISSGVDGIDAYNIALRNYTTLPLTADEVHRIGLDEVARIKAEMHAVIESTEWRAQHPKWIDPDETFKWFVEYLRTDSRFYYDNPEDLLVGYRNISKLIDAEMPRLFTRLPRLPYGVRPIPAFASKSAPTAYYYPGSTSSGVPGYFMANLYDLKSRPKYDMVALTLHEGVPGHHHQIALAQEQEGRHAVRKLMGSTAFSEGWGLYAERLGLEVGVDTVDDGIERGLYADPYDEFGRLNFEMWRAIRLVVDTGLHAKGWTRGQALDYALSNSALTEVNANNEIDRYIGWPGQATAYKIGQLKILELRERAERALGNAFDLRAFHDAVLENGSIPLPVLESRIDRWIEEQS